VNAVIGYVSASDLRLSGRVRRWAPPRWFRVWMVGATRFGDGWGWFAIGTVLLSGSGSAHRTLAAGTLSTALANAVLVYLKRRVRRRRPCEQGPHPLFRVKPPDDFSFPSGHATNAFAICTVVSIAFPFIAPVLAILAASVAASRVVLGLHYASDVLVGALIGATCGLAAVQLL